MRFTDLQHQGGASAGRQAPSARAPRRRPRRPRRRPAAPVLPEDVLRILDAVPEMRSGERMELNQAAEALRSAKLLGRSGSSLKLFKKHPELFALTPETRPSKVQYLAPRAR